jgi:hypothetical protein
MITMRLVPTEAGTRVQLICGRATGSLIKRKMTDQFLGSKKNQQDVLRGLEALRQVILKELAEGVVVLPQAVSVPPEAVAAAAQASLVG